MTDLDLHHELRSELAGSPPAGPRSPTCRRSWPAVAGVAGVPAWPGPPPVSPPPPSSRPRRFVVTSGTTTPTSPGVAAAPGAVSSVEPVDGHGLEMTAAVTEALPTAELASQSVTNSRGTSGFFTGETTTADGGWEAGWSQTYAVDGLQQLLLTTNTTTEATLGGQERPWNPCGEADQAAQKCTTTQVGDRLVTVDDSVPQRGDGRWIRNVQVTPADGGDGPLLDMSAFVFADSREEAEAKLPSVETLTELALDERLVPPVL